MIPAAPDLSSISRYAFVPEKDSMESLLPLYNDAGPAEHAVKARASGWLPAMRRRSGLNAESLMHTYGLNTEEGAALMSLAEALLRIPDAGTADALIQDTLGGRHWERYTGDAGAWPMRLSGWGLLISGKWLDFTTQREGGTGSLAGLLGRLGEPVLRQALRQAMRLIGGQFVLGQSLEEAMRAAQPFERKGYCMSYDILGEGARSEEQAQAYVKAYLEGISHLSARVIRDAPIGKNPGMSIKLSALYPRYQLTHWDEVRDILLSRLLGIAKAARQAGISLSIDAEEASRLDVSLMVMDAALEAPELSGWSGLGLVVQAYQKRAPLVIKWLARRAQETGRQIPVRLVKGAYWDSEIKAAQVNGLTDYPVFTRKSHTDISYVACAGLMLASPHIYPQFATHNARTLASVTLMAEASGKAFEVQRLHGMGEALHDQVVGKTISRIYAPVGPHKDLLAYLIRRLMENGANSSFVHLLMDENTTEEDLLANPISLAGAPAIPLPEAIYPDRRNSHGMDFGNHVQLQALEQNISAYSTLPPQPQDTSDIDSLVQQARAGASAWANKSAEERASILEKTADLLEAARGELVALCVHEAGKNLPDSMAEVREAADFCRYYAMQARRLFTPQTLSGPVGESNSLHIAPRGVFACISPWNFPLAIFMGQVTAALAAGNSVVAKPAPQTPRIAKRACELLYQAGLPQDALKLVFGGREIGAKLIAAPGIDGVAFTGSTDAARAIQRSLAEKNGPIIPFIAETGGQNCMVVDSSALLEQAVDDIMLSAFGSAGQRCSALRVLYVQEDIFTPLTRLLAGAMQSLRVGDPLDATTDIGPVIDQAAKARLDAHTATLTRLVARTPIPEGLPEKWHYVAPACYEISDIGELPGEIFGPILHVIRFRGDELPALPAKINATGFGLTFGVHSRIDAHIRLLTQGVHAGNIYVNRSMTGAVVGVQPFGGEGLSGTGFKAGGPHYLLRFIQERCLTVNTAAIGGNVALLAAQPPQA